MAERTLLEAVADLRLSDARFDRDLAAVRRKLLSTITTLEQDARVNIKARIDEDSLLESFVQMESFATNQPIVAQLTVNSDKALSDLAALEHITDGIVFPVRVNTGSAASEVAAFTDSSTERLVQGFTHGGEQAGSGFATKLGGSIQGIIAPIAAAAGGFLASTLFAGFNRLTTIQDATASLTVALGDAASAAKLLDEVLGVVRGTPFNLDQFALAASNMVSFGIEAQKVPGYLTAIGEAAASRGSRANEFAQRLSTEFGQISTQGKLTGESLITLQEAGVNALAILGNQTGKTTAEMRDLVSKGAIPAKFALDALSKGILEGTTGVNGATNKFAGTMAGLRNTLTGSIGGFKAATARFGVDIIDPIKDALTTGFQGAAATLDRFGGQLKKSLSGIAGEDTFKNILDFLKDLPDKVEPLLDKLSLVGPALAPIIGFLGASGLGSLKTVLGPLGGLIPELFTKPLVLAVAAFAIFTPEVRDSLIPLGEKLAVIFGKIGAAAAVTGGKLLDELIPIIVRLADVAVDLLPLVDTAANLGIILAQVLIPPLKLFGTILTAVPIPVLEALVVLFTALALKNDVGRVLDSAATGLQKASTSFGGTGLSASKAAGAVQTAGIAIGAAFSGMAFASDDASTKITGGLGVIASTAAAFATGGPIAGAVVGVASVLGFVAGQFTKAADEARALKEKTDDLAASVSDATIDLDTNAAAVKAAGDAAGDAAFGYKLLGDAILAAKDSGPKLSDALSTLRLPSSGSAGAKEIIKVFQEIGAAGDDIQKVPTFVTALEKAFTGQGTNLATLISDYSDYVTLLEDIQTAQQEVKDGLPVDDLGDKSAELEKLARALNGADLTDDQSAILKALIAIRNEADDTDLPAITRETLKLTSQQSENHRVALELAEDATGFSRNSKNITELITLQTRAEKELTDVSNIRHKRITEELLANKANTEAQVTALFNLAASLGKDIFDILPEGTLSDDLKLAAVDVDDVANKIDLNLTPALTAAQQAAKDFEEATKKSKDAWDAVTDAISRMQGSLSNTKDLQTFEAGLSGIAKGFGEIINAADIKAGEGILSDIHDQRVKIQELQADVASELADAKVKGQLLEERIAEAKALGSTRGVALLELEQTHLLDAANKKQSELDKADAKLGELEARLAKLKLDDATLLETLKQQANDAGLSVFDLLLQAPTPEALKAFQTILAPSIEQALSQIQEEAKLHGGPAAAVMAAQFKTELIAAFTAGGLDVDTATKIVSSILDPVALEQLGKTSADATAAAYLAELQVKLTDPTFQNQFFGGDVDLPVSVKTQIDEDHERRTHEKAQETLDKIGGLRSLLQLLPPDSEEAKIVRDQIQALLAAQEAVTIKVTPVPLTPEEINAIFANGGKLSIGGGLAVFKDGGFWPGVMRPERHYAHIMPAGQFRVSGEPETGGEGYVPMAPWKRGSSTQIVREIADVFGYHLVPKMPQVPLPSVMTTPGGQFGPTGITSADADAIGRAVARHTARTPAERAADMADRYDRSVKIEKLFVGADPSSRQTAKDTVRRLSDLSMGRG